MKQLIKELTYRAMYTLIALSTIVGFIYLNIACQIEYMWYVYHMDSECIDFCWFESINQGHSRHPCEALGKEGMSSITRFSSSLDPSVCTHLCPELQTQGNKGSLVSKFEPKAPDYTYPITNHSIAHNHGLFLTLVSVFIEHESQLHLKLDHVAMLAWYPFITMIIFQKFAFWLPAMLGLNVLNGIAINHIFLFILWVHEITLPTGILFYKEFQMEPSDSELFASGQYIICIENMAQVYFIWLIGLCILSYTFNVFLLPRIMQPFIKRREL